jgi:hypothetical protein
MIIGLSAVALFGVTQTVTFARPVETAHAQVTVTASATILQAERIDFERAPPPKRSRVNGEWRRLVEFR